MFRPTWKYFSWQTALAGFLWCLVMMFMISWYISIAVIVLVLMLYLYINSHKARNDWGDSSSGLKFSIIRQLLDTLDIHSITHAKNWRPQALVMFQVDRDGVATDDDLLLFAGHMKKGRGLLMFMGTLEGDPVKEFPYVVQARDNLADKLKLFKIEGFCRVIAVRNAFSAFIAAFQSIGIGALRPNTVVTNWNYDWKMDLTKAGQFVDSLKTALIAERAIIIFKQTHHDQTIQVLSNVKPVTGTYIDIWWIVYDGGVNPSSLLAQET